MLCRLPHGHLIREEEVIGIFDLDRATEMPASRKFLREREAEGKIQVATDNIPRSFLITEKGVYFAQGTPSAVYKSLKEFKVP